MPQVLQTLLDEKAWEPTAKMERLLAVAKKHWFAVSVATMEEEAKLPPQYFNQTIRKTAQFARWWVRQSERHFAALLPRVWGKMFNVATGKEDKAKGGDWQAQRLFLERFDPDYVPRNKTLLQAQIALGQATDQSLQQIDQLLRAGEEASPLPAEEALAEA